MFGLNGLIMGVERPDRFENNLKKDENYHLNFGRYCIGSGWDSVHDYWRKQIYINTNFW